MVRSATEYAEGPPGASFVKAVYSHKSLDVKIRSAPTPTWALNSRPRDEL